MSPRSSKHLRRIRPLWAVAASSALLICLALPAGAGASFGVLPGSYSSALSGVQAGGHRDFTTEFTLNTHAGGEGEGTTPDGDLRSVTATLPPGLLGNPSAYPQCSSAYLNSHSYCPADTQVGVFHYSLALGIAVVPTQIPVYNMVPRSGRIAELGLENIFVASLQFHLLPELRVGGDYGLTVRLAGAPVRLAIVGSKLTIWGVPADPSHDGERGDAARGGGCLSPITGPTGALCPSGAQPRPYLASPTQCQSPIASELTIDSWQNPGAFLHYTSEPQQLTGCEEIQESFQPSISLQPTSHEAGAGTGLEVDLHIPQPWVDQPDIPATPHLKKAVVTLPQGMALNSAQAEGLGACTPAQIGYTGNLTPAGAPEFTPDPASCPDSAKVGSLEIDTPLLKEPLSGSVYLAQQKQNPFGALLSVYLVAEGQGAIVKLPGKVEANPQTGRLTATFDQNPQLPFEDFHLRFFGGERSTLVNPGSCGTYTSDATLTSWAEPQPVSLQSSFDINAGCSRPFAAKLSAGTANPLAGAYSPFSMLLSRPDGTPSFGSLSLTLPEGLLGKLAGIPYCSEAALAAIPSAEGTAAAQIASPSCPASQLGSVTVGAGAGSPFYLHTGKAYLAGPYKGAPLSLAVITPAQAGPFDLGNVLVRVAMQVDPSSTRITAVSDPLPTILDGIPLNIRELFVNLDRPGFTLNPTSCDEQHFSGTATSAAGQSVPLTDRFQVGSCERLGFKPDLKLKLSGKTKRAGHPALKAVLTYPKKGAYANIASAQVGLPHSEFLDQGNIGTVCTQPQLKAKACPAKSVYGHAKAWSPLLDRALEGPVYLGVGYGHKLPDLVAELDGQIRVLLHGKVDTGRHGGIRNTFEVVPDAPVSRFVLELKGGKRYGLLENSENICRKTQRAEARFTAQNGKVAQLRPRIANDCGGGGKRQRSSTS
jgi:hypothetical protein